MMSLDVFRSEQVTQESVRKSFWCLCPYKKKIVVETITASVEEAISVIKKFENVFLSAYGEHLKNTDCVLFSFGILSRLRKNRNN